MHSCFLCHLQSVITHIKVKSKFQIAADNVSQIVANSSFQKLIMLKYDYAKNYIKFMHEVDLVGLFKTKKM